MKRPFGKLFLASLAALVLASIALAPVAEAAVGGGRGGGGGGGGGGGARAAAGGGGGGARQPAQVNNSRADARTNDVRSSSVNNVNIERNVNVNVEGNGGWDNDYHPVARAAAVTGAVAVTSAAVGSMVASVPPNCVPVNYGGMVYQQCGNTWYQSQGSQYVVVNPPY
jgi:hypothetical protein